MAKLHQLDEAGAARRGVALRDQLLDRRRDARCNRRRIKPEIGQAHDLALAHRNPTENLRQIFAGADAHDVIFDLAEVLGFHQALGISAKLADRVNVSREPGKAVSGTLFAIEDARRNAAIPYHPLGHRPARIGEYGFDGLHRLVQRGDQFFAGGDFGLGKRHKWLRALGFGRSPDSTPSLRVRCTNANRGR